MQVFRVRGNAERGRILLRNQRFYTLRAGGSWTADDGGSVQKVWALFFEVLFLAQKGRKHPKRILQCLHGGEFRNLSCFCFYRKSRRRKEENPPGGRKQKCSSRRTRRGKSLAENLQTKIYR